MTGATDIKLNVTMDASQARAEAERLHRELTRRYRRPSAEDALRKAWDTSTGMPPNPMNPDLPYEPARHSGIWWANQRGIRGLGNSEYRHQFFTEREAKYMGLQFAKQANKELLQGAKSFGAAIGMYALNTGVGVYYGWQQMPGLNNRRSQISQGTITGGISGAGVGAGAAAGLIGLAALAGAPFSGGMSLALLGVAGGVGAGIGAWGGNQQAKIAHRNEDVSTEISIRADRLMRQRSRMFGMSDWAMNAQMGLMPSREGKLGILKSQLAEIQSGRGAETISKLEAERKAMVEGGVYNGHQYQKGDWQNTERGRQLDSILNALYARRESVSMQYMQTKYSMPHAAPMSAITDEYSRRGLSVGAQVNVQRTNTIIVDKMKTIIGLLESIRKNSTTSKNVLDVSSGVGTW